LVDASRVCEISGLFYNFEIYFKFGLTPHRCYTLDTGNTQNTHSDSDTENSISRTKSETVSFTQLMKHSTEGGMHDGGSDGSSIKSRRRRLSSDTTNSDTTNSENNINSETKTDLKPGEETVTFELPVEVPFWPEDENQPIAEDDPVWLEAVGRAFRRALGGVRHSVPRSVEASGASAQSGGQTPGRESESELLQSETPEQRQRRLTVLNAGLSQEDSQMRGEIFENFFPYKISEAESDFSYRDQNTNEFTSDFTGKKSGTVYK
jgi:hypothetical protein